MSVLVERSSVLWKWLKWPKLCLLWRTEMSECPLSMHYFVPVSPSMELFDRTSCLLFDASPEAAMCVRCISLSLVLSVFVSHVLALSRCLSMAVSLCLLCPVVCVIYTRSVAVLPRPRTSAEYSVDVLRRFAITMISVALHLLSLGLALSEGKQWLS